ncbi:MAG TPA: peptidoglycan-associated lipoprotein Pal [Marinobacter sp.]|nr:peptidoglycan-associated lipoprotein Pal [Marinobacter sp.]
MKLSFSKKLFAMVLSAGLVAGCSSTGEHMEDDAYGSDVQAIGSDGSTVYGGQDGEGISSGALSDDERRAQSELQALRDITTFYFDFDTSEIKQETRDVLIAHARFLADNPRQKVRLEGHADERGTKEYNLALGERRANSVERFLIVNGASRGQIETVSYGEEKPAVRGATESAHAQNRRVELIFQ